MDLYIGVGILSKDLLIFSNQMRKLLFSFLSILLLTACATAQQAGLQAPEAQSQPPENQTQIQEVALELSEIKGLPADLEGSLVCTVRYTPGYALSAQVQNNTGCTLISGYRDGSLDHRGEDGEWTEMDPGTDIILHPIAVYTEPGGVSEAEVFSSAGFYEPMLEAGTYRMVFSVWLVGDGLEDELGFKLKIPFSVG